MKNFHQGNKQRSDSYSNYSAGKSHGKFGGPVSHKARCAECGNNCTVPFKPNGSKPVLCHDCFRGSDRSPQKRTYNDRPSYQRSERRPSFDRPPAKAKPAIGPTLKEEIKGINKKLEKILELLGEKKETGQKESGSDDTFTFSD